MPSFNEDFNTEIDESVWQIARWVEHDGQTGRERCYADNGKLKLMFVYSPNDPGGYDYLSSAIQTREQFLYGRWEARIKPTSEPGVLNSLYTIDWDEGTGTRQEIDIEFLTYYFDSSYGRVHFAVHAMGYNSFDTRPDIELDFNPSDDFHVWGVEITPKKINWFVDDVILEQYEYDKNSIAINSTYQLKLNSWSKKDWIKGPPEPYTECIYEIDWIKFYPWIPSK